MDKENINISSIYGVDEDIEKCPKCGNPNLNTKSLKIQFSGTGPARHWLCKSCETVWVKGLKKPRYNP